MIKPPVNIGDSVYVARAWSYGDKRVPCPVCYGQLFAVLVLGNGEQVQVECEACALGYMAPQGWVNEPCAGSAVDSHVVTGVQWADGDWHLHSHGHQKFVWGVEAFDDAGAAEAKRAELQAKAEVEAFERAGNMARHARKKLTWHVLYHRKELRRAEHDVAYHGRKLSDTLARQRKAKKEEV